MSCKHARPIGLRPRSGENPAYAQWCPDCGAIYIYDSSQTMTAPGGTQVPVQGWFEPGHQRFEPECSALDCREKAVPIDIQGATVTKRWCAMHARRLGLIT